MTRTISKKTIARAAKRPASRKTKSSARSTARAAAARPPEAPCPPAVAPAASSVTKFSKRAATGSEDATASATRCSTSSRAELARRGEALVAALLEERGFEICGRNVRVGRLELDVVARRGALLVVCEVRSRSSARPVFPAETIRGKKLARVRRATAIWLRQQKLGRVHARIDAAAVLFDGPNREPRIEYYENVSFPFRHV